MKRTDLLNMDHKPDGYYKSERENMLKYIPDGVKSCLEFGCGNGGFSALIKREFGAECWAIEINETAAAEAGEKLDKVINSDAVEALNDIPDRYFDCVIFLDILEHLITPYELLEKVKSKLTDNAVIVTSIPNVRYYRNVVKFALKGQWDYKDGGTLDKTHLRFFTRSSILKMFESLGFEVLLMEGRNPARNKKFRLMNRLLFGALDDMKYVQFVTVAQLRKKNEG